MTACSKKLIAPTVDRRVVRHLLCNGEFTVEVVAYLGRFSKPAKSTAITTDWLSIVINAVLLEGK